MNTTSEVEVIQRMLIWWAVGFGAKTMVFGFLFAIMAIQKNKSRFGVALTVHYLSIMVQASVIALMYAQYAASSAPGGDDGFLTFQQRMIAYGVGSAAIAWVVVSGAVLVILWFIGDTTDGTGRQAT